MKKALQIAGVVLAVLALLGMTAYAFANAPAKGSMGVWGYVAAEKNAKLEVDANQVGGKELKVYRVVAPTDAWIVVHTDENGMPGERVGLQHISGGETTNVTVALKNVTTDKVIVAVHNDMGTPNKFDFDMNRKTQSEDRPFFVNGMELAKEVSVK